MKNFLNTETTTQTETNTPTGWENMDEDLPAIIDADTSRAEIEATPEDYEKFARTYFSELLDALDNPKTNATPEDEQAINDQIAITADLFVNIESLDSALEQNQSKDVFDNLANKYASASEENLKHGETRIAERNHRFANAVDRMEDSFNAYLAQAHPQIQVESSATTNNTTLPGDVIQ